MTERPQEQQLILVRHGQTESNVVHALDTRPPGAALTPRGQAQARAMTQQWSGAGVDALYRSHLLRTALTITGLADETGLPVAVREGLREVEAGQLEMSTDTESLENYYGAIEAWHSGDLQRRLPGGETGAEVLDRFDAVVDEIAASGVQRPLVVSHGAVIRLWTAARASGINVAQAFTTPLRNCCAIVVVRGSPREAWRFQSWQQRSPGENDRSSHARRRSSEP